MQIKRSTRPFLLKSGSDLYCQKELMSIALSQFLVNFFLETESEERREIAQFCNLWRALHPVSQLHGFRDIRACGEQGSGFGKSESNTSIIRYLPSLEQANRQSKNSISLHHVTLCKVMLQVQMFYSHGIMRLIACRHGYSPKRCLKSETYLVRYSKTISWYWVAAACYVTW